jgi:hypothetical protein
MVDVAAPSQTNPPQRAEQPALTESFGVPGKNTIGNGISAETKLPERLLSDGGGHVHPSTGSQGGTIPASQFLGEGDSQPSTTIGGTAAKSSTPASTSKSPAPEHSDSPKAFDVSVEIKPIQFIFDGTSKLLLEGSPGRYLDAQLVNFGGVVILDRAIWESGVEQVKALCVNLANLIANGAGVRVVYTDISSDPSVLKALLSRNTKEAEQSFDLLLSKIVTDSIKAHHSPTTSGGKEDRISDARAKLLAYVGLLRLLTNHSIKVQVRSSLPFDDKGKPVAPKVDPEELGTYVILGRETGLASLPKMIPDPVPGRLGATGVKSLGDGVVVFDAGATGAQTRAVTPVAKPAAQTKTVTPNKPAAPQKPLPLKAPAPHNPPARPAIQPKPAPSSRPAPTPPAKKNWDDGL